MTRTLTVLILGITLTGCTASSWRVPSNEQAHEARQPVNHHDPYNHVPLYIPVDPKQTDGSWGIN
jgi:hypothetical protein